MDKLRVTEPIVTLTCGPVDAYPAVLRGLSRTIHYDFDPYFQAFYERVNDKLRTAFRIERPPVILHGGPGLGLEAAAASLIGRDDVHLNLVSGVYGKGFGSFATRHCKEYLELEVPYDEVIDPERLREMFRRRPDITTVFVCHHDTPSGTINPVAEIGRIVREHEAYLIVDTVSSFGGMSVQPDDICADIFVTGPNKCLGTAPGVCLLAVSDRAWGKMEANPAAPRGSILSILDWREAWHHEMPFPFTPSMAEVNSLDAALDLYLEEGPEAVWARHAATAAICRAGIQAMGLRLWPAREAICSPTTTAVRVPDGYEDAAIRAAARARFGVVFSSGRGATLGKLIRIGHMGPTAHPVHAVIAISSLGGALTALGMKLRVGDGVEAALAQERALAAAV